MRFAFDYAIPMIIDFQKDSCSRAKRAGHIAWTPPSLNNTVVFLGGNEGNEANWDAEIWPGDVSMVWSECNISQMDSSKMKLSFIVSLNH